MQNCIYVFQFEFTGSNLNSGEPYTIKESPSTSGLFTLLSTNENYTISYGQLSNVKFQFGQSSFTASLIDMNGNNVTSITVTAPVCEPLPYPLELHGNYIGRTYVDSGNLIEYAGVFGFDFRLNKSYTSSLTVTCDPFYCQLAPYTSSYVFVLVGYGIPITSQTLSNNFTIKFRSSQNQITTWTGSSLISVPEISIELTTFPLPDTNVPAPGSSTLQIVVSKPYGTIIKTISDVVYFNNYTFIQEIPGGPLYNQPSPYPIFSSSPTSFSYTVDEKETYLLYNIDGTNGAFRNLDSWIFSAFDTSSGTYIITTRAVPKNIGVVTGTYQSATIQLRYMLSPLMNKNFQLENLGNPITPFATPGDTIPPVIDKILYYPLQNCSVLVQIWATDLESGLHRFELFDLYTIYAASTISNPQYQSSVISSGIFEAILESKGQPLLNFDVKAYDNVGNVGVLEGPSKTLSLPLDQFPCTVPKSQYFPSNIFDKFLFLFNEYNSSTEGMVNTLFINFTQPMDKNSKIYLIFDHNRFTQIPGQYDHFLQMWAIDFVIPMNPTGLEIFYSLSYPDTSITSVALNRIVGASSKLTVNVDIGDRMPPIVISLEKLQTGFGYKLLIEDSINGLKNGEVRIQSSIESDPYLYKFTPQTSEKDPKMDSYEFQIPTTLYSVCNSDITFQLVYVKLVDNGDQVSIYDKGVSMESDFPVINPLYNIVMDKSWDLEFICTVPANDVLPPTITDVYDPTYNSVDVGQEYRFWKYAFEGSDPSGLSTKQNVYCRLYTLNDEIYIRAEMSVQGTTFNGLCATNLPYGWGQGLMQGTFRVSIHGVTDVLFNMAGFENTDIIFSTTMDYNTPYIDGYYPITTRGGALTIKGHKIGPIDPTNGDVVQVKVSPGKEVNSPFVMYDTTFVSCTLVVTEILPPTGSQTFYVTVIKNNISSNILPISSSRQRGSPFPLPPTTIQPTSCPGTPPCNGPDHGSCTNKGCVCTSSYRGNDCSDKIIPNNPPKTDGDKPTSNSTTEIPTEGGGSITVTSLISVIALNEINYKGESVKNHSLSNWKLTNTSDVNANIITSVYSLTIVNDPIVKTNISVQIQFYRDETIIEFAGQELRMYPSSLKYSIDIGEYKFAQSLNTLQLIMSVGISTSDDEIGSCITQEIGNTTESDSEFYKLQINDHSLYGRFIKRGIVDNNIRALSSTIQTSIDDNSKSNSIQSLIAINIPHYSESVLIDPDFSILLDSQPAQDKDDSICTAKSDKGLSKSQLAGIIIGCIAFAAIVAISIAYVLYKRKRAVHFQKKLKKLTNINKQ
ncbi:hypothetical protein DLAC_06407 [Tieghemostelium lacteum]|uniref:EGF-like domain-containing protein n=1 Tax=Tieghemostelium lacteum TaxID=361077 RepID=A0A151ZEP7_TIELA|nr:hypothetical protein DLAC_06407 [Tieghemostelium lacteum]|eukprot:KYQ92428.1 hypothetical protein DLAC_06407 [Tieghemostelium lacteum]